MGKGINKRKRLRLTIDMVMQVKRQRNTLPTDMENDSEVFPEPLPRDTENDSEALPEHERGLYTIDEVDEDEELESDDEVE